MAVLFPKDCGPNHNLSDSDEIWAPSRDNGKTNDKADCCTDARLEKV
jgi:hypothetical protein